MAIEINSTVAATTSTETNTIISQIDSRVTLKNQERRTARTVAKGGLRRRRSKGTASWNYLINLSTNTRQGATVVSEKPITGSTVTNNTKTRRSGGY